VADNIVVSDERTHFPFSSMPTQEHMCTMFMEIAWIGVSKWVSKLKMKILFPMLS